MSGRVLGVNGMVRNEAHFLYEHKYQKYRKDSNDSSSMGNLYL